MFLFIHFMLFQILFTLFKNINDVFLSYMCEEVEEKKILPIFGFTGESITTLGSAPPPRVRVGLFSLQSL